MGEDRATLGTSKRLGTQEIESRINNIALLRISSGKFRATVTHHFSSDVCRWRRLRKTNKWLLAFSLTPFLLTLPVMTG
jgi:hypothetical protein